MNNLFNKEMNEYCGGKFQLINAWLNYLIHLRAIKKRSFLQLSL